MKTTKTRRTIVIIAFEDSAADRHPCKWDWHAIMRQADANVITTHVAADVKDDATEADVYEAVRDGAAVIYDAVNQLD